jgi:crossover junction endodeoxyribonuclease RusA
MSEEQATYGTPPLSFFIQCVPPKATSQQKGICLIGGKPRHFKKKNVADAENSLTALLMPHRPAKPIEGAVALSVTWTYPWRSSETKRNKALGYMPCTTKPDADNLVKMLGDCMTRLAFWNDDAQVADLRVRKGWGDKPGIGITVEAIPLPQFGTQHVRPDVPRLPLTKQAAERIYASEEYLNDPGL